MSATVPALDAFTLRCWARACLFRACVFDLHEAVGALWVAAVKIGLVDELGLDAVRTIVADAFEEECT